MEIILVGFGEERPAGFGDAARLQLDFDRPVTPREMLARAGIQVTSDLLLMNGDVFVPSTHWNDPVIHPGDQITLMSAIEGG